jgi:hypothetical protein
MIHYSLIMYGVVALAEIIVILHNYFSSEDGGMWYGGKRKYSLDFIGWINIVFLIVFTLVFGGFFWW